MAPRFPGPYLNDTKADDPIMKRVDVKNMEIGARPSGVAKEAGRNGNTIEHVGGTAGGKA